MQKEYTQTKEQVLEGLRTDRQGLSAQEAEKRLREHGENRLKEAEKLTLFQRFVQQLKDPMLLILLAAAAVSALSITMGCNVLPPSNEASPYAPESVNRTAASSLNWRMA